MGLTSFGHVQKRHQQKWAGSITNNLQGRCYDAVKLFIIHPCDPTVVVCYLIRPCDIAVCITYLMSHSYSLTYNLRIFQFGCIINTKLPSCNDIIRCTSLSFPSWCPESTRPMDSCFQGTSCENLMMYGGLYQHTRVVLYTYSN